MELQELQNYNFYKLAKDIIKYQDFRPCVAIRKMGQNTDFKKATISVYLALSVKYLKTGERSIKMPSQLYGMLDKCKSEHVQPLVPSSKEQRVEVKRDYSKRYQKKDAVLPIQQVVQNKKLTSKFEYGVSLTKGNYPCVYIFKTEEEAKSFLFGMSLVGLEDNVKIVSVELGNV